MIAQYLAIDHPDLVERLVLAVTAPRVNEIIEGCVSRWIGFAEQGNHKALMIDPRTDEVKDAFSGNAFVWLDRDMLNTIWEKENGEFLSACVDLSSSHTINDLFDDSLTLDDLISAYPHGQKCKNMGTNFVLKLVPKGVFGWRY